VRIAHSADWHIGLSRYGQVLPDGRNSRIVDFERTLERFVQSAITEGADLAIFAGDTFHTRREGPEERAAFARGLSRLARSHIPVIVGTGNHDGMSTVGDPSSHSLRWLQELALPGVQVVTEPGQSVLVRTQDGPTITVLPYPHKRAFDVELAHLDPEDRVIEAGRRLESAIALLADQAQKARGAGHPSIFVGHLTVAGSRTGSEATMKLGWDIAVSARAFDGFDYAALGHIHAAQQMDKAVYPGSPEYIDFGDATQVKGWVIADVEVGQVPVVRRVPSGARQMVDYTAYAEGDTFSMYAPTPSVPLDGAMVRLIIEATKVPRSGDVAGLVKALRDGGASFVKVDVRIDRPDAVRVDADPDLDIIEATRRWLNANGHAEEPAITMAQQLIAAGR